MNGISPQEAATRLRVSLPTVYKWAHDGILKGVRFGGRIRLDPVTVDRVARHGTGALTEDE